jgi:hypothetical protein
MTSEKKVFDPEIEKLKHILSEVRIKLDPAEMEFSTPDGRWNEFKKRRDFHQNLFELVGDMQRHLAVLGTLVYQHILKSYWEKEDRRWITREPEKTQTDGANRQAVSVSWGAYIPPKILWAEEFVALIYINFIMRSLIRIRWLVLAATGIFVLLLLSVTVYPFEPRTTIHASFILLFLAMLVPVSIILSQMHRDATLSHLTDTRPGELGGEFWMRIAGFAAVPVFSLITTEMPELNRALFFWVKPLLNGLSKG